MPDIDTPHFDYPFRFSGEHIAEVEQDTIDDVFNCVAVILSTPLNIRPESPGFGIRDLTFDLLPADIGAVADEIAAQEPRSVAVIAQNSDRFDDLVNTIHVDVSTRGASRV